MDLSVTNNKVLVEKNINALQKLSVMGFLFGNDNYGEDVIGVSKLPIFRKRLKYYTMVVNLRESETHTSTSGIGFYENKSDNTLMVYSSKNVMTVYITEELRNLLNQAEVSPI